MFRLFFGAMGIILAFSLVSAASSQTVDRKAMTLQAARNVIAAAEAEATRINAPAVVAVVDDGGWLIALERMDGAPMLASVDLAPGKARAAAVFRKSTQALEEGINRGRTAEVTAPGYVQMQGGIPIMIEGQVVGALGVSAATPNQDQQIAEAGVRALSH